MYIVDERFSAGNETLAKTVSRNKHVKHKMAGLYVNVMHRGGSSRRNRTSQDCCCCCPPARIYKLTGKHLDKGAHGLVPQFVRQVSHGQGWFRIRDIVVHGSRSSR